MPTKSGKKRKIPIKKKYRFFLNPYTDMAFTKCPKCDTKTKLRKLPLVIHIEPKQLFILNKTCRYCSYCDLIIAKQAELEALMAAYFEKQNPEMVGNKYLVFGTVERKDWKEGDKGKMSPDDLLQRTYVFKDVWNFDVTPGGWQPADKTS